jgi:hypothetical protein
MPDFKVIVRTKSVEYWAVFMNKVEIHLRWPLMAGGVIAMRTLLEVGHD